jgi:hypothetical protein
MYCKNGPSGIGNVVWQHNLGDGTTGTTIANAGGMEIEFDVYPGRFSAFEIRQTAAPLSNRVVLGDTGSMFRIFFGASNDGADNGRYSVYSKGNLITQSSYLSGEQQPVYDQYGATSNNEKYRVKVTLKTSSFGAGNYAHVWVEVTGDFDNNAGTPNTKKMLDLNGNDPGDSVVRFSWTAANAAYLSFYGGSDQLTLYDNLTVKTACSPTLPESNICPGVLLTDSFNRVNGVPGSNDNLVDVNGDLIPDGQVGITYLTAGYWGINGNTLYSNPGVGGSQWIVPENLAVGPGADAIRETGGFIAEVDVVPLVTGATDNDDRIGGISIDSTATGIAYDSQASIVALHISTAGIWRVYKSGTLLASGPISLVTDQSYHLKLEAAVDNNFGIPGGLVTVKAYIDGVLKHTVNSSWTSSDLAVLELWNTVSMRKFDNLAISTFPDDDPPVITCNSATVNIPVDAPNQVLVSGYDLVDLSGDPFPNCLTVTSNQGTFTCDDVGANTVTVTVVDSGGNSSTCAATVTVTDTNSVCCTPTTEVCDGVDNDCDGDVDEDIAAVSSSCGIGKCASTGSITCVGGALVDSCVAGTPDLSDASCNNVDDDCNGAVDEDYVSTATSCGVGACASTGSTSCVAGVVTDSCTAGTPAASDATCDGIDDDCSGTADEDYASVATSCGVGACASTGSTSCVGGSVQDSCTPGTPTSDANCDGIDNDCDGAVDDGYVSLSTSCGVGACAKTGSTSCVSGSVVDSCTPGAPTSDANCDNVDNDCDGAADDDYVSLATSCGVGACASAGATSCVTGVVQDSCDPTSTDGAACGDAGTECTNQDLCSNGTCQDNGYKAAGTACGSASSNQCDAADTCNGAGVCQANNVANGTACDDNNACTDSDSCQAGVCASVPGLFAADSILWQAPLAVSPSNEDTDPSNVNPNDSKVGSLYRYSFKVGSTIPVKIRALGCTGADVTAYSNVQAHVSVWSDVNCDGVGEFDLPENFTGVGGPGGLMVLTDGKLHFNLKTTGLTTSGGCLVLQVTVTDNNTGDTTTETVLLKAK